MAGSLSYIISEPADAKTNMSLDSELFNNIESGNSNQSLIRIYSWNKHCITFGRSQTPDKDFKINEIQDADTLLAVRPTGGGMVFHSPEDLTYCMVLPKNNKILPAGIEAGCTKIHEIISAMLNNIEINCSVKKNTAAKKRAAFEKVCFSTTTRYELSTEKGLKIAGSAQKKGKHAIMIQGHIPNSTNYTIWSEYLKKHQLIESIKKESTTIFNETKKEFAFSELSNIFIKCLDELSA